jgi:DNA repair protein RadC
LIIIFVTILVSFICLYLINYWLNSEKLTDEEINELALSQRFWDIYKYFDFNESQVEINKEFKSTLNKDGQFYNCNESLKNFPAIASALLKSKKHEWIIIAFSSNKIIKSFYTNKGVDNESVVPNLGAEIIKKIAMDNDADLILDFHNHPNSVLLASQQDIAVANYLGKIFTNNGLNFIAFVTGKGNFHLYGLWVTDTFYDFNNYLSHCRNENGKSRSINYKMRKELKRKKLFMNSHISKLSHNFLIMDSTPSGEKKISNITISSGEKMVYLEEVIKLFKYDLRLFPTKDFIKMEIIEKNEDKENKIAHKYYYKLPTKEFGLFEDLEMIDFGLHKNFNYSTNFFNINDIEYLVTLFYKILGNDLMGKGNFDIEDITLINKRNWWDGRIWDYEKHNFFVMISYDNEGPTLDLSVKW